MTSCDQPIEASKKTRPMITLNATTNSTINATPITPRTSMVRYLSIVFIQFPFLNLHKSFSGWGKAVSPILKISGTYLAAASAAERTISVSSGETMA